MRAIMVSVDYSDLLAVTLPYNRHHFDSVTIVTSNKDFRNVEPIAAAHDADVIKTDLFYADGAVFGKWQALEHGLDVIGRSGWICLMDADVLWPKIAPLDLVPGQLCSPLRRMLVDLRRFREPPDERCWSILPVHRNIAEWAGYTQIFHASDPVLGSPPWHETDWRHAGGADSFFQAKWAPENKVRPKWDVLHLGPAGVNWCGRATEYLGGTAPVESKERAEMVRRIWSGRRGKQGPERFREEKLN